MNDLWINLALEDLRDRYRRTALGLAWIVVSFALFVAVKVAIFGQLSSVPAAEFGLFVTLGFGLWTFINSTMTDACTAYTHARHWILGTATPYPVYILQSVARNIMTFMLVFLVMVAALALKPSLWSPTMLWAIPGLLAYALCSVWLTALLAPLCVYYRDLHHAVQTFMRLLFFATPILWLPSTNGMLASIAVWNPASHFVAIVREPLLYGNVPLDSWLVVAGINLAGLPAGILAYARSRSSLIFWI
ncbi:ABC transporter permease [Marilutibacter maris]|nr:ABC transporter permease [Lysobacter maris]